MKSLIDRLWKRLKPIFEVTVACGTALILVTLVGFFFYAYATAVIGSRHEIAEQKDRCTSSGRAYHLEMPMGSKFVPSVICENGKPS